LLRISSIEKTAGYFGNDLLTVLMDAAPSGLPNSKSLCSFLFISVVVALIL
jgi:hypothetical protein